MKYYICIICGKVFQSLVKKNNDVHCNRILREITKEDYIKYKSEKYPKLKIKDNKSKVKK